MSTRVVGWVVVLALTWCVGARPAHACSYGNEYLGANPPTASTLPSGEVYVASLYHSSPGLLDDFHVTNAAGDEIPVTVTPVGDAVLLRFDSTGAEQVSVFGELGLGGEGSLATYDVSPDAPDLSVPTAPTVVVNGTTCSVCPDIGDSCCSRPDGEGAFSTSVSVNATQEGTILGWTNDGVHLAGVLTRTTYASVPVYSAPGARLPPGADIVAMSVAGVMSSSVTWALGDTGPCEGEPPVESPTPTLKEGCVASPGSSSHGAGVCLSLGFLLLLSRRRARSR